MTFLGLSMAFGLSAVFHLGNYPSNVVGKHHASSEHHERGILVSSSRAPPGERPEGSGRWNHRARASGQQSPEHDQGDIVGLRSDPVVVIQVGQRSDDCGRIGAPG